MKIRVDNHIIITRPDNTRRDRRDRKGLARNDNKIGDIFVH